MPLTGIRVLDFTQAMAGPACSMLLGDFGAAVIKVEPPGGEGSRTWGVSRFGPDGKFSALYLAFNRNKASIVLDLKSGLELLTSPDRSRLPGAPRCLISTLKCNDRLFENYRS